MEWEKEANGVVLPCPCWNSSSLPGAAEPGEPATASSVREEPAVGLGLGRRPWRPAGLSSKTLSQKQKACAIVIMLLMESSEKISSVPEVCRWRFRRLGWVTLSRRSHI